MLPKVMIIEDDPVIQEIYALKFELEGYPVVVASNGELGLEQVETFAPHYILLDMMMPVMNGLEFMEQYRPKQGPDTEVIVFSNISAPSQMEAVMGLGVRDYWIKSDYTPEQVVAEIAQLWSQRLEGQSNAADSSHGSATA